MAEQTERGQAATLSRNCPVILHLSDLHFGLDNSRQGDVDAHEVLGALMTSVLKLPSDWKPTMVCITGDITWKGQQRGYDIARPWIQSLLKALELPVSHVIVCPGNHDCLRDKALARASEVTDADKVLTLDRLARCEEPFERYIEFCEASGFSEYTLHDQESHLVGKRLLENIRFVVCNSAWFSQDDHDAGQLWLGLGLLRAMQLPLSSDPEAILTVSLLHHPHEFLHISDRGNNTGRPGAFPYLVERSHLILSGHTHELPAPPDIRRLKALHIRAGSAYSGIDYPNTFCVVRIETEGFRYHYYRTEPGSSSELWRAEDKPVFVKFPWLDQRPSAATGMAQEELGDVKREIADRAELCRKRVQDSIAQTAAYLDGFEYPSAFESAEMLAEFVESHRSLIPRELLVKAYIQLGETEVVKVNLENVQFGKPKDFSRAVSFVERAKDVGAE